jgi:hypothetical protein
MVLVFSEPVLQPGSESCAHATGDGPGTIAGRSCLGEYLSSTLGPSAAGMERICRDHNASQKAAAFRQQSELLEPNAAGIDTGATEFYVAVPSSRDPQPVRRFSIFTDGLNNLVDWLQTCGVESVAMESTSVFWIPLLAKCNYSSQRG